MSTSPLLRQGKTVDLVAMKDGKKLAIEVETGKSDAVYNIKKDLEAVFDKVICVGTDWEVKKKILEEFRRIDKRNSEKVAFYEKSEFLLSDNTERRPGVYGENKLKYRVKR